MIGIQCEPGIQTSVLQTTEPGPGRTTGLAEGAICWWLVYLSAGPGSGGFPLGDAPAVGFTVVLPLAVLSGDLGWLQEFPGETAGGAGRWPVGY